MNALLTHIKTQWTLLNYNFFGTIGAWQNQRYLWLLGGAVALLSELFAVYFFQGYLALDPCEMCVYIRFSMLVILFGAAIGALNPSQLVFKLTGYIIVIYGIVRGILWSINLELIMLKAQSAAPTTFISTCKLTEVVFPFSIPLDRWFPEHFSPTALCGEDSWQFLGLNMAEYMLIIYAVFSIFIVLMLLGWVHNLINKKPA